MSFVGRIDDRSKEEVKRSMPAFGIGWLDFIDHIFFHLPFTGPHQANVVRCNYGIKKEDWEEHHATMRADHRAPGAREELRASWKAHVAKYVSVNKAGGARRMGGTVIGGDDD